MAKKQKNKRLLGWLLGLAGVLTLTSSTSKKEYIKDSNEDSNEDETSDANNSNSTESLITNPNTSDPDTTPSKRDESITNNTASSRGSGNSNANPGGDYGSGVTREPRSRGGNTKTGPTASDYEDRTANNTASHDKDTTDDFYEQRVFVSDATIVWKHVENSSLYSPLKTPVELIGTTFVIWGRLINMSDVTVEVRLINVAASIINRASLQAIKFYNKVYTIPARTETEWIKLAYYDMDIIYPLFDYKFVFQDMAQFWPDIRRSYFYPARVFFRYDVYLPYDGYKIADCHSEFDTEVLSVPTYNNESTVFGVNSFELRHGTIEHPSLTPYNNKVYRYYLDLLRTPSEWKTDFWSGKYELYPYYYIIKKAQEQGKGKFKSFGFNKVVYSGEKYPEMGHYERAGYLDGIPAKGIVYTKDGGFAYGS